MNEQINDRTFTQIEATELAHIEGGAYVVGGDGHCGTPFPGPRPLAIAEMVSQVIQVVRVK